MLDVGFPGGIAASLPELLNEAIIRTTWFSSVYHTHTEPSAFSMEHLSSRDCAKTPVKKHFFCNGVKSCLLKFGLMYISGFRGQTFFTTGPITLMAE